MKTYTDNRFGYKIDLSNDWVLDNYEPPVIARILFRIFYGGPLKKGMAFARGSNDTLETLNISVEKMSPDVSPELTRHFFIEHAQQSGYTISNFGKILVGGREHTCVCYQIAENVWSKKYMIVLNGIGYAITTCLRSIGFPIDKEDEWDTIARSLRLV